MTEFNTRISDQNRIKVTTNLRGVTNLHQLTNVDVTNLSNNSFLVYNSTTGKWTATSSISVGVLLDGGTF